MERRAGSLPGRLQGEPEIDNRGWVDEPLFYPLAKFRVRPIVLKDEAYVENALLRGHIRIGFNDTVFHTPFLAAVALLYANHFYILVALHIKECRARPSKQSSN